MFLKLLYPFQTHQHPFHSLPHPSIPSMVLLCYVCTFHALLHYKDAHSINLLSYCANLCPFHAILYSFCVILCCFCTHSAPLPHLSTSFLCPCILFLHLQYPSTLFFFLSVPLLHSFCDYLCPSTFLPCLFFTPSEHSNCLMLTTRAKCIISITWFA